MSTQTNRIFLKGLAILGVLALTALAGCAGSEEQTDDSAGATGGSSSGGQAARGTREGRGDPDRIVRADIKILGERFRAEEVLRDRGEVSGLSDYPVGDQPGAANWGPIWGDWTDLNPKFSRQTGLHFGRERVKVLVIDAVKADVQAGTRERLVEQVRFYRDDLSGARLGRCVRSTAPGAERTLVNCTAEGADPEAAAP